MKFATLFGLAAMVAMASTTLPAFAAEDDEPARVTRDWNSGSKGTVSRGSAPNQRGTRTNTVTRDTSGDGEPKVTNARPSRDSDDDNDYSSSSSRRQRHHEYGGLDPAEAARIRNAHRESDRRVTLHRDRDDYDVPSYRSRHQRRQHWWSMWW